MADPSPPAFSSTKVDSSPPSSSVIDGTFCVKDVDVPLSPRKYSPSPSPSVPLEDFLSTADAAMSPPLNDLFYTFLKTYPTIIHSSPSSFGKLRVFWSQHAPDPIKDKVRCAFESLQVDDSFGGLIQFWAPVKTDGGELLTTSYQPFTLATLDKGVDKYRLCSLKYQYNVDVTMDNLGAEEVSRVICDGSPSRTFLNQTPELFPDLMAQPINPLVCSALECGLMSSVVLPVFYPSKSFCVGVVECSMSSSTQLLNVFNDLNTALEKEGFKTFDARDFLPYNTIHGLMPAKEEIDEALKIILHSHHLAFAHVWIAYEDDNLSSLEDGQAKQILGLKLTDHYVHLGNEDFVCRGKYLEDCTNACYRLPLKMDEVLAGKILQKYSDACYRFPLIMGEGFIGETLKRYEPYFVKDISKLSDTESVLRLLSLSMNYSCFVIYLRSTKTSDLDYVFEFLWSRGRKNVILLESLLLTLKRHLPSFQIAYGTELGDEIYILDVENSTDSENKYFKILQRNKISRKGGRQSKDEKRSTPLKAEDKTTPLKAEDKTTPLKAEDKTTPLEAKDKTRRIILPRELIESQFGHTQKKAAENLRVSLSTLKRNCRKLGIVKWQGNFFVQSGTDEKKDKREAVQDKIGETPLDENMVTIKVEYADDVIRFTLPISSATIADIGKEIGKKFKLDPATRYKIKYLVEEYNEWILFTCDEDVVTLFTKNKRIVRLRLLQGLISDPSHTYQLT